MTYPPESSRSWANYHSHSFFCDGNGNPEEYVNKAIDLGMKTLGISSHAPVPFETDWNMLSKKVPDYLKTLMNLKDEYKEQITLLSAMEVDYIPGAMGPRNPQIIGAGLDYVVGSVHFAGTFPEGTPFSIDDSTSWFVKGIEEIFEGDIKKLVKKYFELQREMLEHQPPQIIGHVDKVRMHNRNRFFFDETSDWYLEEIRSTLKLAAEKEVVVEVNTKYFDMAEQTFPSKNHFSWMAENNIPITINSDAHNPEDLLSGFYEVAELLQNAGVNHLFQYKKKEGRFIPMPYEKDGVVW